MSLINQEYSNIIAPGLIPGTIYREAEVLGSAVWLWAFSKEHKEIPIHLLHRFLFPAITQQQFILISENKKPIFYLGWALFNAEAEYRYIHNPAVLMPLEDWNCGDRMWILDWVSPFGHTHNIARTLQKTLLRDKCARYLYHRGAEKGMRIMTFRGASLTKQEVDAWLQSHPILQK